MQIVECVPNFSEGRDRAVIDAITAAITAVEGVTLLDVDMGADTNRTVVTFVGEPRPVVEAAFAGIARAAELIDMHQHHGAHPRMGATDVCPFVPVRGVSMSDCVALAQELGRRVGDELGIWVYLYEQAANRPERMNLAAVRKGEYEGLAARQGDEAQRPDFGPPALNEKAGATAIGAREFLIAYNINLNTRVKKKAHDIALDLREQGRFKRGPDGKFVRDAEGRKIPQPGLFKSVKAVGWVIDEYNCAQISMNLTDYKVSPLHLVFDKTCELAWERGLRVTGSELVGLIPEIALLDAGRYFLRKQGLNAGVSDDELIRVAVQSMGLDAVAPFEPEQKIVERRTGQRDGRLVSMSGRAFVELLASSAPAPGGGSVAALAGAQAVALTTMVATLTHPKKGFEDVASEMQDLCIEGHRIKENLLRSVDADTEAFDAVMAALKLPKKSPEDKTRRQAALAETNQHAAEVPLQTLELCLRPLEMALQVVEKGNPNSLTDGGVAALMAEAGAVGAYYNVLINLASIADASRRAQWMSQARDRVDRARKKAAQVHALVEKKLEAALEVDGLIEP